ncbi:MAG TPA: amidohydrolase [Candidatus Atribacteria bacterium]|nr:amidohydrolase [Candidatus Atribacteria bacterium]
MKLIIDNIDIISMDEAGHFYRDGVIVIDGDTIEYAGAKSGLKADHPDAKRVDGHGMLALPGFVNTHTHVAMTIFRGYANDMALWDWLAEKIWPAEELLTGEDAYWATLLGAAEMIQAGVTTFADMYMFMTQTARAVEDCGIRAVLARGLSGPDGSTDERHREVEELRTWRTRAQGRITTMIGPHSIYTCSRDYLKVCKGMAEKHGVGIHIHLSETEQEVRDCIREHGCTPVRLLMELGLFDLPVLAAHCVHLNDEDIEILAESGVRVSHNPSSNLKLSSGFAPVTRLLERGICVAFGTDGAASNNNLSVWKEMTLASLIAKGQSGDPAALPAKTALRMATAMGAKALSLDKVTGSLEKGKKADIILIDTNKPHYFPKGDREVNLVYSGYSQDVDTVIVNGRILMAGRELTTIDMDRVHYEVDKIVSRILG